MLFALQFYTSLLTLANSAKVVNVKKCIAEKVFSKSSILVYQLLELFLCVK